ncbi:MAG: SDR family oxidoreductase [Acidobacteria bacterium]|nr:MAG: SDR family oxidoreductase [Acidobacteriota bacterium]
MTKGEILITGASGQIGWHLCRYLASQGYRVTGTYHSHKPALEGVELRQCDLTDVASLSSAIGGDYQAVIHAAAYTNVDKCEKFPDMARRVNVEAIGALASLFPPEVRFICISTDLVFNGERGRYGETDRVDPVNMYAETKAAGEKAALGHPGGIVVRLALVYGPDTPFSFGFSSVMKGLLEAGKPVPLFVDQYRTPVYVGDILRALQRLVEQDPKHRIYHLGGAERVNRWEFGRLFVDVFGYDRSLLQPVTTESVGLVRRGKDCSLDCSRLAAEFGFRPSGVLEGLRRMKQGVY